MKDKELRKVLIKTDILEQLPLALTKEEDAFSYCQSNHSHNAGL